MRTLLPFLGVVAFVGVFSPSASATPLTLQYRCDSQLALRS